MDVDEGVLLFGRAVSGALDIDTEANFELFLIISVTISIAFVFYCFAASESKNVPVLYFELSKVQNTKALSSLFLIWSFSPFSNYINTLLVHKS